MAAKLLVLDAQIVPLADREIAFVVEQRDGVLFEVFQIPAIAENNIVQTIRSLIRQDKLKAVDLAGVRLVLDAVRRLVITIAVLGVVPQQLALILVAEFVHAIRHELVFVVIVVGIAMPIVVIVAFATSQKTLVAGLGMTRIGARMLVAPNLIADGDGLRLLSLGRLRRQLFAHAAAHEIR